MSLRSAISKTACAASLILALSLIAAASSEDTSLSENAAARSVAAASAPESVVTSAAESSEPNPAVTSEAAATEPDPAVTSEAAASTTDSAAPAVTLSPDDPRSHVRGIRNFSLVEGMIPDPMTGVSWDETIGTVLCDTTQVDWTKLGAQKLTYTIADMDQNICYQTITVRIHENLEYYLYGMEGEKKVPVGSSFDPMEGISYDDKVLESVTADVSALDLSKEGEYPVSYELKAKDGRTQSAVRRVRVSSNGADGWDNSDNAGNYSTVVDLGVWRLTAYMDTPHDQGPYVGQTASGAPLVPGRTVAVSAATCNRLGLYFGDKLLIDGHVYTLEDHGGSAMNNQDWADIFVDNPIDEFSERFNHFTEVYLLR